MIARVLLFGLLAAATVYIAVMSVLRRRSARAASRSAHTRDFRFAASDPFDIPRRYGDLALIACGHSPRASNVTHGQMSGRPVRGFDFRCEAGHAARRMPRHYSVLVVEACDLPDVLMWHVDDLPLAPLAAREGRTGVGAWQCVGDEDAARRIAGVCGELAERPVSVQSRGGKLLFCVPAGAAGRHALEPGDVAGPIERLLGSSPGGDGPASADVANHGPAR